MARPRTPTNILKLKGADKRNPSRFIDRENEPQNANPIGEPPESLSDKEREAWRVIVKECIDGVLGEADRQLVAMAAKLMIVVHEDVYQHQQWTLFNKCLTQLGMTPNERSKISIPQKKPKNKFDD